MGVGAAMTPIAQAQTEAPSDITVTGNATVVSDYRSRGISLTGGSIAFQPSINVEHVSGLYAGIWASSIDTTPLRGGIRTHIYGGYETEIASGTTLDVGITYFAYPDGDSSVGNSDFAEVTSKISYLLGPVEAQAALHYMWDQSALGSDNIYASFGLGGGVPNTPISLRAHIGHMDGALVRFGPNGHYWDWSVGASANLGPVTAGVKYVDTSIPTTGVKAVDKYYDSQLIFSLGVSF